MTVLRARDGERGDIVLGWLTKLTVVLAVVGVALFDAVSIGVGHLKAADRAHEAARAAREAYGADRDVQRAYEAALAHAGKDDPGATVDPASFAVAPDGAVTLTVRTTSPTLVVEKLPPLRDWAEVSAAGSARPPS